MNADAVPTLDHGMIELHHALQINSFEGCVAGAAVGGGLGLVALMVVVRKFQGAPPPPRLPQTQAQAQPAGCEVQVAQAQVEQALYK